MRRTRATRTTGATASSSFPNRSRPMRETWTFHTAGKLLFGRNAVRQLGEVAGWLGAKRVLVATDAILEKAGVLERVRVPLAEAGVAVEAFTGGEPEPSFRAAEVCIQMARQTRP